MSWASVKRNVQQASDRYTMSLLVVAQLVQSLCCLCTNVQQQRLIVAQTAAQGGVLILASQDARYYDLFSQVCLQLALVTTTAGICLGNHPEKHNILAVILHSEVTGRQVQHM